MVIFQHKFLVEAENKNDVMELDPLLEIKHLHEAIDKRIEWFKQHKKVSKNENKQNQVASCVQKGI